MLLFYRCRHFSKLKLNVRKRSKQRRHVSSSTHDLFCSIRKHSIGSNRTETERHQFHKKHLILSFSLIWNPITAAAATKLSVYPCVFVWTTFTWRKENLFECSMKFLNILLRIQCMHSVFVVGEERNDFIFYAWINCHHFYMYFCAVSRYLINSDSFNMWKILMN